MKRKNSPPAAFVVPRSWGEVTAGPQGPRVDEERSQESIQVYTQGQVVCTHPAAA